MEHANNKQALLEGPKVSQNEPSREAIGNSNPSKRTKTKGYFKYAVEKGWQIFTKSFWETLFDRVWPK